MEHGEAEGHPKNGDFAETIFGPSNLEFTILPVVFVRKRSEGVHEDQADGHEYHSHKDVGNLGKILRSDSHFITACTTDVAE